jgi:hypothetical protein
MGRSVGALVMLSVAGGFAGNGEEISEARDSPTVQAPRRVVEREERAPKSGATWREILGVFTGSKSAPTDEIAAVSASCQVLLRGTCQVSSTELEGSILTVKLRVTGGTEGRANVECTAYNSQGSSVGFDQKRFTGFGMVDDVAKLMMVPSDTPTRVSCTWYST